MTRFSYCGGIFQRHSHPPWMTRSTLAVVSSATIRLLKASMSGWSFLRMTVTGSPASRARPTPATVERELITTAMLALSRPSLNPVEDVEHGPAAPADEDAQTKVFLPTRRGTRRIARLAFVDVTPGVQGLVDEGVGFLVLVPRDVPDGTAREFLRQCDGPLVQRADQGALDLVLAVELPHQQLAVAVDRDIIGPQVPGGLQRLDQGRVFGDVVRRLAQENCSGLQRPAGGVLQNETRSGRARIAPAAAIRACDQLHGRHCASERWVDLVSPGAAAGQGRDPAGSSRAASRRRTGHSLRFAERQGGSSIHAFAHGTSLQVG